MRGRNEDDERFEANWARLTVEGASLVPDRLPRSKRGWGAMGAAGRGHSYRSMAVEILCIRASAGWETARHVSSVWGRSYLSHTMLPSSWQYRRQSSTAEELHQQQRLISIMSSAPLSWASSAEASRPSISPSLPDEVVECLRCARFVRRSFLACDLPSLTASHSFISALVPPSSHTSR